MKFTQVVKRMEKIAAINILEQKKEILRKFFESIFDLQTKFHDEEGQQAVSNHYQLITIPNVNSIHVKVTFFCLNYTDFTGC